MSARILCPYHNDGRPSMMVYETHAHCFTCSAHPSLAELEAKLGRKIDTPDERALEDVQKTIEYIRSCPTDTIRGLNLHYDDLYFFIVWPSNGYYKRRFLRSDDAVNKYKCPQGVPQPLFELTSDSKDCVIVEGELNALSMREAGITEVITSPGGVGNFVSKKHDLTYYDKYDRIVVAADADKYGTMSVIQLCISLKQRGKKCVPLLMEKDANEMLQYGEKQRIKEIIETAFRSI